MLRRWLRCWQTKRAPIPFGKTTESDEGKSTEEGVYRRYWGGKRQGREDRANNNDWRAVQSYKKKLQFEASRACLCSWVHEFPLGGTKKKNTNWHSYVFRMYYPPLPSTEGRVTREGIRGILFHFWEITKYACGCVRIVGNWREKYLPRTGLPMIWQKWFWGHRGRHWGLEGGKEGLRLFYRNKNMHVCWTMWIIMKTLKTAGLLLLLLS